MKFNQEETNFLISVLENEKEKMEMDMVLEYGSICNDILDKLNFSLNKK